MNLAEKDILKRVVELFSTYGVRSLSMDDIARRIPLAKRNLLEIAKNKEDLIRRVFEYRMALVGETMHRLKEQLITGNVIDEILSVVHVLYTMTCEVGPHLEFELHKYYPLIYSEFAQIRKQHIINGLSNNIERGKEQGVYNKELDTRKTAEHIFAANKALIENYLRECTQDCNHEHIFRECVNTMIELCANEEGKRYFAQKTEL
ncbi:MAG: TetR/AcrR family transcriptional regulator [Bacteroidales bacterium]|nr:TetR/AcrR family transcriptional regulator [Bacteroidales bacterium]